MDALNIVTSFRQLIMDHISEIHTSLPARVTSVDYGAKTVHLESIVKNKRGSDDEISYPTMYDVPFMINGGGNARISFPIKSGDIGTVIFAERDISNAMQTSGEEASSASIIQPCGMYPVCFIPKIATGTDSTESVDENSIVISNNKNTYSSFDPDGNISIYNSQGMKVDLTTTGISLTDGSGTLSLTGGNLTFNGGTFNINGLIIDENGLITDSNGVAFHTHTHRVSGVESGSSTVESDIPVGE
ncbi:hypothetical protein [Klebsiella phage 05F01]|nr:hypothetical protein [Klebsiella phage 05F01]